MKGLSNNTKTIATLFLFVCLAANSQLFQSSLTQDMGSSSIASSIKVERSTLLPSNTKNCALKSDSQVNEEFTTDEKNIVNYKTLREKISDEEEIDDSNMSAREKREAARQRRNATNNTNTDGRKILFKYNYKTYICETEGGTAVTKREYELTDVDTAEGSIQCPGGCKFATSQFDNFEAIANELMNESIKKEINLKYEIAKLKVIDKKREDNCEGVVETYSDGSTEFFAYDDSNEDDESEKLKCLVRNIKNLKNSNKEKSMDLFADLEEQIAGLIESGEAKERKKGLELINKLLGVSNNTTGYRLTRSGRSLPQQISTSLKNMRKFAQGATVAEQVTTEYDKHIEYYKSIACTEKAVPGCLSELQLQAQINDIQMRKLRGLEFGKHNSLGPDGWSIYKGEGGDESYKTWHQGLENHFDETMQKISGIYTGPADINKKLADNSPTSNDYRDRNDFLVQNNRETFKSQSGSLGKDVGMFSDKLKNFR